MMTYNLCYYIMYREVIYIYIYIYTLYAILYRKPVIMPSELLDVIKCC